LRFVQGADFNDFLAPDVQSRALMKGFDPYSPEVPVRLWPMVGSRRPDFLLKDLADGTLIAKRGIPTAYPLTCLFMLIPLAVLPWPLAYWVWFVISVGLALGTAQALADVRHRDGGSSDGWADCDGKNGDR
jgi:hypothetical protein